MIFWIDQRYKEEYIGSANCDGLRCRYPVGFSDLAKTNISKFIAFVRKNYYFPIRLSVVFFDKTHFISEADGHKYYGIFYDGGGCNTTYPKICIASRINEKNLLEDVLFTIAHEITHYYQWYFLEDEERTDRSLEIEANKWAKYIFHMYVNNQS